MRRDKMYKPTEFENEQLDIMNPLTNMPADSRDELINGWPGFIRENILPNIDENSYEPLYSKNYSRPNASVSRIISALLIKEKFGWSDQELIFQMKYNVAVQYALDIKISDQPISIRTFSRFRERLVEYEKKTGIDLVHNTMVEVVFPQLNESMNLDDALQRMDSFLIESNTKPLSRLEIIYHTILINVRKFKDPEELPELLKHYAVKDDENQVFYYDKDSNYEQKSQKLTKEILCALEFFRKHDPDSKELRLLERVFNEQFTKTDSGYRLRKDKTEGLNSQTLQTPYDPDATFRQKKGNHIGYVANIVENVGENASMYQDYQYEQNIHSDSEFLQEQLERNSDRSSDSKEHNLVTDGGYSGIENEKLALEKGIELYTTDLTGRKPVDLYADFKVDETDPENKIIIECANNCKPLKSSYYKENDTIRATFKKSCCENCPLRDECKPRIGKRGASKTFSVKSKRRAESLRKAKAPKYQKLRKARNGVEAIPSNMRNKHNIDKMPVRGLIRTRLCFSFKIGGSALNKYDRFMERQKCLEAA